MSHRIRFSITSLCLGLVFFALLVWAAGRFPGLPTNAGFLVPVLAVVLAAEGASVGRKAMFAAASVTIFGLADAATIVTGMQRIAGVVAFDVTRATPAGFFLLLAYHAFSVGFPIVVLMLFVGRRPSVLWRRQSAAALEE